MFDTASSTARIMDLQCSGEKPSISINGSIAPRKTHRSFGLLRSSIFSRKARLALVDRFLSGGCLAAKGFIVALVLRPTRNELRGTPINEHNFGLYATDFPHWAGKPAIALRWNAIFP
jgi:hypothetical protein